MSNLKSFMKRKELQSFRNKSLVELDKAVREYMAKLNNLKFDLAAGKVKNIKEIKNSKKSIAQLLTLKNNTKENN